MDSENFETLRLLHFYVNIFFLQTTVKYEDLD
jgi:hypothetical protein